MRPNLFYRILVSSYAVSIFPEGILLPVYAIFVQRIGGDILGAGGALGVFLITQGLCTMVVHRVPWSTEQRIRLLVGGWMVWLLGIMLYLVISNIWTLFLAQVLTAIGSAVADPIAEEEIAIHTDKGAEEFEWGFFEGSNDIVSGIAAVLGGIVVTFYSFRVLIYLMIATATVSFMLILWYVSRVRKASPAPV